MASIEIIIRDDEGRILSKKHYYYYHYEEEEFDIGSGSFHEIEGALETFKHQALPELERTLLEHEQTRFSKTLKKEDDFVCVGTKEVTLRGMHGKVRFRVERYRQCSTGLKRSYFDPTDQFREGYFSLGLKEFVTYYAGRISYEEVEGLLVRTTGAKLLSDQKIRQLVVERAAAVSRMRQTKITCLKAKPMPAVRRTVDLYDAAKAREVVLLEDAIQLKQQKAKRERRETAAGWQPSGEAPSSKQKRPKKRVTTDVAMLQKREVVGSYEHLCGGIDEHGREALYDVAETIRTAPSWSTLCGNAAAETPLLAVVAITEGAKNIRSHLESGSLALRSR